MGAEGARVTYPYLSGQWTEQKQYDDTFILVMIIRYCFFSQSIFLYALAFLFTYLT